MNKFIDVTIKPVLILGGIGTALAGLDAFLPRFAVENVQKLGWVPEYTIFVQHWGMMVCLMGVFMVAAAFLSMWISNTATAIMMVPIAIAIILQLEERFGRRACHGFTVALMLGIAYACSLGGMATLVDTPPNLSFARIFEITFPLAEPIAFGQWLVMAFPITFVLLTIVWLLLTRLFFRFKKSFEVDRDVVKPRMMRDGPPPIRRMIHNAIRLCSCHFSIVRAIMKPPMKRKIVLLT